jgi:hypothetical protein
MRIHHVVMEALQEKPNPGWFTAATKNTGWFYEPRVLNHLETCARPVEAEEG